ncbi:AMP-binding protein [Nocardia sp. BMG51109]|uniref:AMP-binding protein n=1 Tax=Nocardia sp. BMG51109 TaxID=1056816 RepID=UPI0004656C90|nr:AMP-binding protein [Nocardia sp. BMG51109]
MTSVMTEIADTRAGFGLPAEVRHRVLGEWATGVELSDVVGIAGLLRRANAVPPVRPAVRCGAECLDYGQVFARLARPGARGAADSLDAAMHTLAALAADVEAPVRVRSGAGTVAMSPKAVTAAVADRRAVALERRWDCVDPALGSADVRLVVGRWDSADVLVELLAALADGATLVVPTPAERADPAALAEVVAARSVTHVVAAPETLRDWSGLPGMPSVRRWDVVGSTCSIELHDHLRELSPEAVASFAYRLPEYAGAVARGPLDGTGRLRPIPGARVLVLDEHRQPVPPGTVGDVYAGGAALAEEAVAQDFPERFVDDPFPVDGTAGPLVRTGARASWTAQGWLVLADEPGDASARPAARRASGEIRAVGGSWRRS